MKRKPISELSMQELSRQKNWLTCITLGAGLVLLFLAGIILHQVFYEQQYYMALLLLSCVASIIPGFIGLKEIDQELRRRAGI